MPSLEGPIAGLENGAKSYLIGETALQDTSGSADFENFELVDYKGSENGEDIFSRLGGFGSSLTVNTELATNTPVIRQGTHTDIDYVDLRFVINTLYQSNEKGTFNHTGRWRVEKQARQRDDVEAGSDTNGQSAPAPDLRRQLRHLLRGLGSSVAIYASPATAQRTGRPSSRSRRLTPASGSTSRITTNPRSLTATPVFPFRPGFREQRLDLVRAVVSGADRATKAVVGPKLVGFVPEQGDYWLDTGNARPLFFNGSSWIQAGSSLRPGAFGSERDRRRRFTFERRDRDHRQNHGAVRQGISCPRQPSQRALHVARHKDFAARHDGAVLQHYLGITCRR